MLWVGDGLPDCFGYGFLAPGTEFRSRNGGVVDSRMWQFRNAASTTGGGGTNLEREEAGKP